MYQFSIKEASKYFLEIMHSIEAVKTHKIFFISNLGFCLELGLLNSETEIGTGVA